MVRRVRWSAVPERIAPIGPRVCPFEFREQQTSVFCIRSRDQDLDGSEADQAGQCLKGFVQYHVWDVSGLEDRLDQGKATAVNGAVDTDRVGESGGWAQRGFTTRSCFGLGCRQRVDQGHEAVRALREPGDVLRGALGADQPGPPFWLPQPKGRHQSAEGADAGCAFSEMTLPGPSGGQTGARHARCSIRPPARRWRSPKVRSSS